MIVRIALAAVVIFVLAGGWVLVQRWAARINRNSDPCDLPREECHHCLMADSCIMRPDDEDDAPPVNE